MFDPQKILVLAPHTDDGELGCGGSIARFGRNSKEIYYAAFSSCRKSLPARLPSNTLEMECRMAVESLGIDKEHLLMFDFEVRDFPQQRQAILESLVNLRNTIQPDLVFTPAASDIHQDHQVIHQESLRAFRNSSILGYELPWNACAFNCNYFIRIQPEDLVKKISALSKYQSQAHRNYMREDFISSLAKVRAVQCGADYAEAFEVYKLIS